MQALIIYQSTGEPPPPYPITAVGVTSNYSNSITNRQSPTQTNSDYRKSPSSGIYSATSAGSPSPVTVPSNTISPHPAMQRSNNVCQLGSWQRKTHSPIIMQSVKSTQVQKPILQTAIAPQVPTSVPNVSSLPSYASSIQQKSQQQKQPQQQPQQQQQSSPHTTSTTINSKGQSNTPPTTPPVLNSTASPVSNGVSTHPVPGIGIPAVEPPSYASTMAFKAAQQQPRHLPPPPPYTNNNANVARRDPHQVHQDESVRLPYYLRFILVEQRVIK